MKKTQLPIRLSCLILLFAASACHAPAPKQPEAKVTNPQYISNPQYDITYDKTGIASWYGPAFQGKKTASGEIFNENELTAAHRTLPMPSLVRVTNLANGRSAIIRINDRGPFKKSRIIDLSKRAAQELGIHNTARVRVQFLKEETDQYLASMQDHGKKTNDKSLAQDGSGD